MAHGGARAPHVAFLDHVDQRCVLVDAAADTTWSLIKHDNQRCTPHELRDKARQNLVGGDLGEDDVEFAHQTDEERPVPGQSGSALPCYVLAEHRQSAARRIMAPAPHGFSPRWPGWE